MNLKKFHNESNRKGSEGWTSFMLGTLTDMHLEKFKRKKYEGADQQMATSR